MKFNLFLLFLTIFAIDVLAYSTDRPDDHNLMKRQEASPTIVNCDSLTVSVDNSNTTVTIECTGSNLIPPVLQFPIKIFCGITKVINFVCSYA